MELSHIRRLVRLMIQAELSELEIDDTNRGLRVHLKRATMGGGGQAGVAQVVPWVAHPGLAHPGAAVGPAPPDPAGASPPNAAAHEAAREAREGVLPPNTEVLKSPMVGTFYRAPSPEADPFVEIGTAVTEDTVVCIIEAMKVMNEIKAETKGVVHEILVENGEPVEFGQALFQIQKG